MITQTTITIGSKQFIETVSDTYMIQKVGTEEVYSSAVDVINSGFEYIETDQELEVEPMTDAEMLEGLGIQPNEEEVS